MYETQGPPRAYMSLDDYHKRCYGREDGYPTASCLNVNGARDEGELRDREPAEHVVVVRGDVLARDRDGEHRAAQVGGHRGLAVLQVRVDDVEAAEPRNVLRRAGLLARRRSEREADRLALLGGSVGEGEGGESLHRECGVGRGAALDELGCKGTYNQCQ